MLKKCEYCEKEFQAKRISAKFCSSSHKVMFNEKTKPHIESNDEAIVRSRKRIAEVNKILEARGLKPMILGADMPPLEFVSSGISEIDELSKGFPRKRITEVFGLKGVGKTVLMSRIINSLPETSICYIDAEGGLPNPPDNVDVSNEYILEKVQEHVESALESGKYDLIVIDSVASLLPRAEVEGEAGDAHMGLKARLMSQWMRRINAWLSKADSAVVFINQQRESMNPYGPMKFTPGGFAIPYAASLRLELKSNKADRFEGGHWVNVEIEKSRICKPYQKTKFKLLYV